ncbi:unnamed protein product, partial [Gongylonema pulchrum]|uniref:IncF plasmid conjugative transfer DNA-nicking and unwinding protein TraI n=1 Tax=Gongylonema pulchrum TaxID=637853 RepID=A0A183DGZ3_9BILA
MASVSDEQRQQLLSGFPEKANQSKPERASEHHGMEQMNPAKDFLQTLSVPDQSVVVPERNMKQKENREQAIKEPQKRVTETNLAAGLDLREAYAYVNQLNTQNSLATSRGSEGW